MFGNFDGCNLVEVKVAPAEVIDDDEDRQLPCTNRSWSNGSQPATATTTFTRTSSSARLVASANAHPAAPSAAAARSANVAHEKPRRMMYPVQALSHNPTRANGITAVELLALRNNQGRLDADDLELWLLGNGLAIRNGKPHLLVPTSRAHELVRGLDRLG